MSETPRLFRKEALDHPARPEVRGGLLELSPGLELEGFPSEYQELVKVRARNGWVTLLPILEYLGGDDRG